MLKPGRESRNVQVTEVRIKLMEGSEDRLRAFCSITLDHSFVIRDLKVIDGASGPFVAMPSRKLSGHCSRCNYKNHLRAAYCNQCGTKLKVMVPADSPQKLYADVAHPVNSDCREMISAAVLTEFGAELARAAQPGYRSRYDDDFEAISESHDDLFPVGNSHQRSTVREPLPSASGSNVRIDRPHDSPRRSSIDPPSASPRPSERPPSPPGTASGQMSTSSEPLAHVQREALADADNNYLRRIDAADPGTTGTAVDQPPETSQQSPQSARERGDSPRTSTASQIIGNQSTDVRSDSKMPPVEGGFGAGIFDSSHR